MLVHRVSSWVVALGLVFGGGFAAAQDKPKTPEKAPEKKVEKADASKGKPADAQTGGMDPAAMEEAYAKAAAPNDNHQLLASLVGNWKATTKAWMVPDSEPEITSGTSECTMILGGRFLQSKMKGDMGGRPFEGMEVMGYDNLKKKFVSSWVDNMGTGIMMSEGTHDAAAKTLNFNGSFDDPMTGQPKKVRMTLKIDDPDHHTFMMFDIPQGEKEAKMLEIAYVRAK